ncbi:MAG: uncharacterized protein JWN24_3335 [Phycisphaerales bacterium]|nr:uncharacterized protein [Phycisphaerales bacterium]
MAARGTGLLPGVPCTARKGGATKPAGLIRLLIGGNWRAFAAVCLACDSIHAEALLLLNFGPVQRETNVLAQGAALGLYSSSSPDPHVFEFYLRAMDILDAAGVDYAVGGAYALAVHTDIVRHTKDFDVFLKKESRDRALAAFERAGLHTELTHPHWIAKAFSPGADLFIDLIYSSGNGLCQVDDEWLANAVPGQVLGRPARLCAAEEIIWSKAFIQERERFDGADIAHLFLKQGIRLNWDRLLGRFRGNELVLLSHLILFRYIYPSEPQPAPQRIYDDLIEQFRSQPLWKDKVCRGTLLSWSQYLIDVEQWGFEDARLPTRGNLTADQIESWTRAEK